MRAIAIWDAFYRDRGVLPAQKVEMLFAHLKQILKLDRLRLCRPNGAQFHLAATSAECRFGDLQSGFEGSRGDDDLIKPFA